MVCREDIDDLYIDIFSLSCFVLRIDIEKDKEIAKLNKRLKKLESEVKKKWIVNIAEKR
jgi:hypothetical protein